ncbi:MAG: S8 family serine peptidase [Gaiellaceae bacterium]
MSAVARMLCAAAAFAFLAAPSATSVQAAAPREVVVGYRSAADLAALGARVVRLIPALHTAVVEARGQVSGQAPVLRRALTVDAPALAPTYLPGVAWEWQWQAAHMDQVPESVLRAAASVKVAVIDSGADLSAPNVGDKRPATWSVLSRSRRVRDNLGHGTFVASLAAGSIDDGVGIAGFGGNAKLMVVQAIDADGYITDVDEAAAIVYAVRHGAKVINLSVGGSQSSAVERRAILYAAQHDVLVVAAAGNEYNDGNPVEYPAALVQPVGSRGQGGVGLAVGATTMDGARAEFSNTGSYLSLAAPGENVFAAESSVSDWPRATLPWSSPGFYGWASGTSFAAPEVAGAAALVWAANPSLTARQVAWVLKRSASGGTWSPELGWGSLDVAAAVRLAQVTNGKAALSAHYEPRPTHSSPPW